MTSLPLRHVAEVGPRGQVDGRRKLGQEMIRQVEIEVEARQVAALLLLDLIDVELGEHHSPFRMVGVRQREEAGREEVLVPDLCRAHRGELLPGHARGKLDADAFLDGLAARHRHALRGSIAEVVARAQEVRLPFLHLRLRCLHPREDGREVLVDDDGGVA